MVAENANNSVIYVKEIIFLIILTEGIFHSYTQTQTICEEKICDDVAKFINNRLNGKPNPCDDFYEYACGKYARNSENSTLLTPYDILKDRLENFTATYFEGGSIENVTDWENLYSTTRAIYNRCVNLKNTGPYIDDLKTAFCWWGANETCNNLQRDIYTFYRKARHYGYFANDMFSIYVDKDRKNGSKQILYIDRPGVQTDQFGPPFEQISLHTSPDAITNYLIGDLTTTLGGNPRKISIIIKGIRKFHAMVMDAWSSYNPERAYNPVKLKDIKWIINDQTNWTRLINAIVTPFRVKDDDVIVVTCMDCLKTITDIFEDNPSGSIQYGILGIWLDTIPYAFPTLRNQFTKSPQDFCRCAMSKFFHKAVDNAYKESKENDIAIAKEPINTMFIALRSQMEKIVNRSTYMQYRDRRAAIQKVRTMKLSYGVFPSVTYGSVFHEIIKQMGMHSGIHIIYATQRLRKHYFEKMFQHLNETIVPSGTTQKYFSASSLDLHYDYRENSIIVPAAAIHEYFISSKLPEAVNYGLMGTILAHEMAHAFDVEDRKLNATDDWMKASVKIAYSCFEAQYSSYTNPETGNQNRYSETYLKSCAAVEHNKCLQPMKTEFTNDRNVYYRFYPLFDKIPICVKDGERTAVENLADTGGAYIAYHAFLSGKFKSLTVQGLRTHSQKQLFWLSYASRFCSKVNGVVANIKEFGKAYMCRVCDAMHPLWTCNLYHVGNED